MDGFFIQVNNKGKQLAKQAKQTEEAGIKDQQERMNADMNPRRNSYG